MDANENVGPVFEGTVTCEWPENPFTAAAKDGLQTSFLRTTDNSEVKPGKEISISLSNSSTGFLTSTMKIKAVRPTDVQTYNCTLKNGTVLLAWKLMALRARPIPREIVNSMTVVQGQPFKVDCTFASTLAYNVTKFTYKSASNEVNLEVVRPDGVQLNVSTYTIWIPSVNNEHRGVYSCEAANAIGVTSIQIRLRVKSPLAAVWPAIGIAIEVVVLVVIVLLYERKRASQKDSDIVASNDDDDDNGGSRNNAGNSADKKNAGDVRQRAAKA